MNRRTSYADRLEIVTLREAGYSYPQIVQRTGWSYETVRNVCRQHKRQGPAALQPARLGRPPTGPLGTFAPVVRFACLRLKRHYPGWGPDVIRAELDKQPWARKVDLPSPSRIGAYFSQFGDRLLVPRRHTRLQAEPLGPAEPVVHGCWQLDVDERVFLPGVGYTHILNIVDHTSGLKMGARLFPAQLQGRRCRVAWPQYRQALRQAFTRWGLPDRIRTDRDQVLVAKDNYPFPMAATLWLAGLDIEHELIQRVTQNGCVERSHRTWEGRLDGYGPFDTLAAWQTMVDYERWRMNVVLPSRGRGCRRQPPLLVYPEVRTPRRWYRPQDELAQFDFQRVQQYLAQGKWVRRTSVKGQFSLNGQTFNLGVTYKHRWVHITYRPDVGFEAVCPPDEAVVLTFQLARLTVAELTGLSDG